MNLFYQPDISEISKNIIFDKEESRHIVSVLRKKVNDILHVTNGFGFIFEVKITGSNPKRCEAIVVSSEKQKPLPYYLHLAVAPTKLNDRFEWFLEKATEIGVSEITPIYCEHSERRKIKEERFEKILQTAMKQSLKAYMPKLNEALPFKECMLQLKKDNSQKYIAHCEDSEKQSLKHVLKNSQIDSTNITILIGPEGDFSIAEIESALKNNFEPISLGTSRLRTETAAVVACHSVAYHFE